MSSRRIPKIDPAQPAVYQIRLRGHLSGEWEGWFEGLAVSLEENGDTLLTGPVADQAALFGLLKKVRDLGMPLVSIHCLEPGETDPSEVKSRESSTLDRKGETQ